MKTRVKVRVPATTANMGPGFDCLGMALDIWNTVEVKVGPIGFEITGHGHDSLPQDSTNLIHRSIVRIFDELDKAVPEFHLTCHNDIHLTGGLGSSSAALVGGLVAGNSLCDGAIPEDDLLQIASEIEGHPDNVAAAILGGLRLVISDQNQLYTVPLGVPPEVHAVILVPEVRIATEDARRVLPGTVSVTDAVYNMGRIALLVAGMTTNHPEYLSVATQDQLHQPYRQIIFPAMKVIFKAARDAGALGVFLSGSGSTILALTQGREMTVAYEMAEAARQTELEYKVEVTKPTLLGAHLVNAN